MGGWVPAVRAFGANRAVLAWGWVGTRTASFSWTSFLTGYSESTYRSLCRVCIDRASQPNEQPTWKRNISENHFMTAQLKRFATLELALFWSSVRQGQKDRVFGRRVLMKCHTKPNHGEYTGPDSNNNNDDSIGTIEPIETKGCDTTTTTTAQATLER